MKPPDFPAVIAVDFDGVIVYPDRYPDIGEPNVKIIEALNAAQRAGIALTLNTAREGRFLVYALAFCKRHELVFDCVNANHPNWVRRYRNDPRKITATLYIDDHAAGYSATTAIASIQQLIDSIDKPRS